MTRYVLIKLRPPATSHPFRVEVDADRWRIESPEHDAAGLRHLNQVLDQIRVAHPDARFFQSFPKFVRRLRGIDGSAAGDRRLALFFRIVFAQEMEAIAAAHRLQLEVLIDRIALSGPARSTCLEEQGYVEPSTAGGVGAIGAWELPGGTGDQAKIWVVDEGYDETHDDLPHDRIEYIVRPEGSPGRAHGTMVLGVLVARLEPAPVTGIAHGAQVFISSTHIYNSSDRTRLAIDDAVSDNRLTAGDVLLPEKETEKGMPLETEEDIAEAFCQAATLGITVVEPAGNSGSPVGPLSQLPEFLWPVMVGAWRPPGPAARARWSSANESSNYGERVDCQGWGSCVYTTQAGSTPYNPDFGGTSAASSMVAGVVAVVQSISKAAGRGPLPPFVVREKLRDPDLGQPQPKGDAIATPIGPQPDLQKILEDCDLLPDSYLRDSFDDDGSEPSSGGDPILQSPDIIPRRVESGDPQRDFGGRHWNEDFAQILDPGEPGWIYLRVRNRGPFGDHPGIDLYWAYPGTFVNPRSWFGNHIGHVDIRVPGLSTGDPRATRVVSPGVRWVPPAGMPHPCLIAVLHSRWDPAPALTAQSSDAAYVAFVRKHNNIALRNVIPSPPDGPFFWRFHLMVPRMAVGWTGIRMRPELPPKARLLIGLPQDRAEVFLRGSDLPLDKYEAGALFDDKGFFGEKQRLAYERVRKPFGDPRGAENVPSMWLAGDAVDLTFPRITLGPGQEVPLVVGADLSDASRGPARIVVEQWAGPGPQGIGTAGAVRVGRLNLEVSARGA